MAPGLIRLTGDDEKRAQQLNAQIEEALKADRWDDAIAGAKELLALRTRVQGATHSDTVAAEWRYKTLVRMLPLPKTDRAAFLSATDLNARAFSLLEGGKFAESQPLFEQALEIRRRLLGDDHIDTALSYHNLAYSLHGRGKYKAAQPLFEKTIEIICRLLGENHPDAAMSHANLGANLFEQGKYAAAQAHLEKAVEIHRRRITDDHGDTANDLDGLAVVLSAQGKYAEAEPLLEKALEAKRRFYGEEHDHTARGYSNLASNLNAQGRYATAQPLYDKALDIDRRCLREDHPYTATDYDKLAHNLVDQGKYAKARTLLETALAIRRRLLTDDHPDTALSYSNLAVNLSRQGKHAAAQPLLEKSLEVHRRLLSDDHPRTAQVYNSLAAVLNSQGKYREAQPLFEKALAIRHRVLGDEHPLTAFSYTSLARNLHAQGKYVEARDQWTRGASSFEASRILTAFTGLDRISATTTGDPLVFLAAVLARLGQPEKAWERLEEDLGRGLLDELAARRDQRLAPGDRAELEERLAALERLDRLFQAPIGKTDDEARRKRIDDLQEQRNQAQIALGELRSRLAKKYRPIAGKLATLAELQSKLPRDAALLTWVDVTPIGPNAADPDGEHWGVVVRPQGTPVWVPIPGTGKDGLWTSDDAALAERVRIELAARPEAGARNLRSLLEKLRAQRLQPLESALGATALGPPPARRLIVLPSRAMAGIPVEVLVAGGDRLTVSYAPSATVYKYLGEQPRPRRHAGLLALGDPVYLRRNESSAPSPPPGHGLLLSVVARGSNAAKHGLKDRDVLLAYNGQTLNKQDDLKLITKSGETISVEVWRDGQVARRELSPGELGATIDPRPAAIAITEERKLQRVLAAARGGDEDFAPLPATRNEVEAIARLFQSDHRPVTALLGSDARESELDRLAAADELSDFGFIHLAAHGVIDETVPGRSAVILTQSGLPDAIEQALRHNPVWDGRLSAREIQRGWSLNAELVTLSACETALGRESGGEGFVGFTQALLISGARSVCLSLWKVDDTATALLMTRFYQNMLGERIGLRKAMPKAEALQDAKMWLRGLTSDEADAARSNLPQVSRDEVRRSKVGTPVPIRPYEDPHFWAPFVLVGDPD
jgi:tetratricopeptide (TPR) repeat protein